MTRTHIFESWFRSRAVIQVIWTSQRNDIGVQFQSCHRRWDAVGFHFSTHHRTERRKAFKWWWINTTEAKMKEERDEACFMSGAYIVQLWWPWSRAAGVTFDIYEKPQTPTVLYCALSPSVRLYFIIFYSFSPPTSSGSVTLHDDVTSSDSCQPGAGLRFHGDGPDEPTEHAGQHGQRGASPRQAPRQGSHLRH